MNYDLQKEIVINLGTDAGCYLIAQDVSDYASMGISDFSKHGLCEFVRVADLEGNEQTLYETIVPFMGNDDPLILQSKSYKVDEDGVYIYYRMVLPLSDDDGYKIKADLDGVYHIYTADDTIADPVEVYDEAHTKGNEIVVGEKLGLVTCNLKQCLFNAQKDSIDSILKNGCDFTCNASSDTFRRDFLLSALLVLDYYTQLGEIKKAQQLLNRLHSCGGICDDNKSASDCGCGGK